jgi:hypothetical protein
MRDDRTADGDAAGEWLRQNITDPDSQIDITWRDEAPDPVAYRRILEILFSPRSDSPTA